ncbi:MAG TPA: S9 family peptidase [Planctomycetota bacterium]|nr:S9 family peptidase [Planctomycetota bacterium]
MHPFLFLSLAACSTDAAARATAGASVSAKEGATYELERYLNVRGNGFQGFSPDGKFAYYSTSVTGTSQVWRVGKDGWPQQVTWWSDRASGANVSPTDDRLVVGRDAGGNENWQLYLVSGDGGTARDLTKNPDAKHDFGGWSWDGKRIAFSSNARTQKAVKQWQADKKAGAAKGDEPPTSTDVYVLDVDGSDGPRMVFRAKAGELFDAAGFSPDGKQLLLSRANGSMDNDLFLLDIGDGPVDASVGTDDETPRVRHLTPHSDVSDYEAEWASDAKSLWLVTNESTEFHGLYRLDLASGKREAIRTPKAEIESVSVDRKGRAIVIGTAKNGGRELEHVTLADMKSTVVPTGFGIPGGVDFRDDGTIGYSQNSATIPTDVFTWSAGAAPKRLTQAFLAGIPAESFVDPEPVHYKSFDGLEIEGLLYRPKSAAGPVATIVDFHGGPEGQSRPSFASVSQYYVSRGYAYFQPNVRGSTGYGRTFTHLDDVRKREDSVKDGAAGVEWLKKSGVADPKRVVCIGGSYGGYMVLASLTLFPDLWAAGVDVVGVANFVSFLENTSGYRRKLRESEYGAAGTKSAPGADRDFLAEISPLNRVAKIRAPLLVIHGEQDPRVPVGEARQIEEALKKLGRPVEALYYPDEGHGIAKLKNRLDCYPKVVEFLDRALRTQ